MYQITGQWKKLSQKSSTQWVSSIILAILIHCLLLIMFRPVVPGVAKEYSELSSIRVLDLGASSEIQLLQWLDNHDPARLLRPDPESGYSQTIKYTTFHEKPADLQPPPLTGIPYSEAAPVARINLTPRELVYTPGNEWPLSEEWNKPFRHRYRGGRMGRLLQQSEQYRTNQERRREAI